MWKSAWLSLWGWRLGFKWWATERDTVAEGERSSWLCKSCRFVMVEGSPVFLKPLTHYLLEEALFYLYPASLFCESGTNAPPQYSAFRGRDWARKTRSWCIWGNHDTSISKSSSWPIKSHFRIQLRGSSSYPHQCFRLRFVNFITRCCAESFKWFRSLGINIKGSWITQKSSLSFCFSPHRWLSCGITVHIYWHLIWSIFSSGSTTHVPLHLLVFEWSPRGR